MENAVTDWFKDWANVRQQHSTTMPPAGKAIGVDVKSDGIYVKALIVEPVAKELVKAGVYQAFSVGISNPKIIRDLDAPGGRVVGGIMSELSIVDRPANTACKFSLAKRAKDGTVHATDEMYVGNTLVPVAERASLVKGAIAMILKMDNIDKGDTPGHPMRGNQHVTPQEAAADASPSARAEMQSEADAQLEDAKRQAELVGATKVKKNKKKGANINGTSTTENDGMNKGAKNTTTGEKPAPLPAEPGDASVSGDVGDDRIMKGDDCDCGNDPCTCMKKAADGISPPPAAPVAPGAAPAAAPAGDGSAAPAVEDTRSDVGGVQKDFGDDDDGGDDDSSDSGDDSDDDDSVDKGVGAFDGPPAVTGKKLKKGKNKQGKTPKPGKDMTVQADVLDGSSADIDDNSDLGKSFPPAVKRLHDATCAAYSEKAIVKAYGDDPATIIRTTGQEVMFNALRNAVAADMGKGQHVGSIVDLTDAYSTASLIALAAPSTIKEVHAELHKMFVDENKDALANTDSLPSPKNAGQPSASNYKRPRITGGQYRENASGGDSGARVPSSGDTPKGSDFTSGALTTGQERQSPANKGASRVGPGGSSSGTYFGNAAKDQAASAMQALHDHIGYTFPDMCPMGPESGISNTPVAGNGRLETRSGSGLTSVGMNAAKESNAVVNKVYTGDVVDSDEDNEIRKMAKQLKKLQKTNAKLNKQLTEYGSEPDPFRAPVRGVMVGSLYGDDDGVLRKSEIEEYAEMLADSANPDYRLRAGEVLKKLGK